jgi:ABC-type nitrate/sulfonate/bicarbonate transport system ATPase subunit
MSNGPAAEVGEIIEVKFPHPRNRKAIMEHPDYYSLREQLISFLEHRSHLRPSSPAPLSTAPKDLLQAAV